MSRLLIPFSSIKARRIKKKYTTPSLKLPSLDDHERHLFMIRGSSTKYVIHTHHAYSQAFKLITCLILLYSNRNTLYLRMYRYVFLSIPL